MPPAKAASNTPIVEDLLRCDALRLGEFTLSSGQRSGYYVDVKRAVTRPEILRLLVTLLRPHAKGYARIAGTELGAIPLVVALSLETSLPYIMIRKASRIHGTRRGLEGEIQVADRVLLVEDVTTTGSTVAQAVEWLREAGAQVNRAVCVVDRGEGARERLQALGVELVPLVRSEDLLAAKV